MKIIKGNTSVYFNDAYYVRKKVFMDEQGFTSELDDIDKLATHVILYDHEKPIATGRIYKENNEYHIGRICVLAAYRKQHLASKVMKTLEEIGFKQTDTIYLSAQVQAKGFYEKLGYIAYGNEFMDEHCPHIMMKKKGLSLFLNLF